MNTNTQLFELYFPFPCHSSALHKKKVSILNSSILIKKKVRPLLIYLAASGLSLARLTKLVSTSVRSN